MQTEQAFVDKLKQHPEDEATRLIFADWLEERDDPRAHWLRDPDLAEYMAPEFKSPVARILQELENVETAERAIGAFNRLGPEAAPDLLERYLWANDAVRQRLVEKLNEFVEADKRLVPLREQLRSDDWKERREAVLAIGEIGELAAPLVMEMADLLNAHLQRVSEAVVSALGKLGRAALAGFRFARYAQEDEDRDHAELLIDEIEKLGPKPETVDLLLEYLACEPNIAENASRALANLGLPIAEHLIRCIGEIHRDDEWYVRGILADLGQDVVPLLFKTLDDPNRGQEVREAIVDVLGRMGDEAGEQADEVVAKLIKVLNDPELSCQRTAIESLRYFRKSAARAIPHLISLLEAEKWHIRLETMITLNYLVEIAKEATPHVRELLNDDIERIRDEAKRFLSRVGDTGRIEELLDQTRSEDPANRREGFLALADFIKDMPDILDVIECGLADEDSGVNAAALQLLAEGEGWPEDSVIIDPTGYHGYPLIQLNPEHPRMAKCLERALDLMLNAPEAEPRGQAVAVYRRTEFSEKGSDWKETLRDVMTKLLNDPSHDVRDRAGDFLIRRDLLSEDVYVGLMPLLLVPKSRVSHHYYNEEIWKDLPPPAAVELASLLGSDEANHREGVGSRVLGHMKTPCPEIIPYLQQILREGTPREAAAVSDALDAHDYTPEEVDAPHLFDAAADSSANSGPLNLLRKLGTAALPEAIQRLNASKVHHAVMYVLGDLGQEAAEALPILISRMASEDFWTRIYATEAVARIITPEEGLPLFRPMLADRQAGHHVQGICTGLLGWGGKALPLLPELLQYVEAHGGSGWSVPQEFVEVFQMLAEHSPDVVEGLREYLQGPDSDTIAGVLAVFAQLGPRAQPVLPDVLELCNDEIPNVRAAASRAVVTLNKEEPSVVPTLIRLLDDEDDEVVRAAIQGLEELGAAAGEAVPRLRELAEESEPRVEYEAKRALKKIEERE